MKKKNTSKKTPSDSSASSFQKKLRRGLSYIQSKTEALKNILSNQKRTAKKLNSVSSLKKNHSRRKNTSVDPEILIQKPFLVQVDSFANLHSTKIDPTDTETDLLWGLPEKYNKDMCVLLVRDPWWIYCYWEVTEYRVDNLKKDIERQSESIEATVLRVYNLTLSNKMSHFFDIDLRWMTDNWLIDVGMPNQSWVVEVGFRTYSRKFYSLVRSNIVKTPAFGISDVVDEEWMMPDEMYWKIFSASGGFGNGLSSADARQMVELYLTRGSFSSGSLSSQNLSPQTGQVAKN